MRVELAKLIRPALGVILLAGLALVLGLVALSQAADADQWAVVADGQQRLSTPSGISEYCRVIDATGAVCDAAVDEMKSNNEAFRSELIRDAPFGAVLQSPIGAPGVVAGLMASWIGLLLISMIAAVHVAGEWSTGTIRIAAGGGTRRVAFFAYKLMSTFVAVVALWLVISLVLAAASFLLTRLYAVPPLSPQFNIWEYSGMASWRSLPVMLFFSTLATTCAVLTRNVLASVGLVASLGLASLFMAAKLTLIDWSPSYWVFSVAGFDARAAFRDHIWPDSFPLMAADPTIVARPVIGATALTVSVVVLVVTGVLRLRRMEI